MRSFSRKTAKKKRLTILHCVNMADEKEKLAVLGKAARLRAFRKISLQLLPATWFSATAKPGRQMI